ncbi:YjbF family lipoprotein [Oleisolibacter albus]|uniref:YjbF family lipoprotein n=1 Tax=Oleisolibacter albus TaxID=2171757 RepID=UPI000DF2BA77|nr:YjbF family lipoprotein [Oleisolibacter albus]
MIARDLQDVQISRRTILAGLLAPLGLTGCGLINTDSPFWATAAKLVPGRSRSPVTRDYADGLPYASMLAWFDGTDPAFIVLQSVSGNRLTWATAARQLVITEGPYVVQTSGTEADLSRVITVTGKLLPPLQAIGREQIRLIDVQKQRRFGWRLRSIFSESGEEKLAILDREYTVLKITEEVTPDPDSAYRGGSYQNEYWVDRNTGIYWKTRQTLVPGLPGFNAEVLKPYTG